MEWLQSTFTKLQEEIQTQREEFLAEQARFCDADARENLKKVVDMLNPLADETGAAVSAEAADEAADALPWERAGVPEERIARMKQLSMDHMAFLTLPPEDTDFSFDLKASMPIVLRLLKQDQQIERWRFLLVPKRCGAGAIPRCRTSTAPPRPLTHAVCARACAGCARRVTEEQFFRNYFYQLAVIAGDVAGPPEAASPVMHAPAGAEHAALAAREQRSATPSADSVGGSVVSIVAPSAESEQFEMISNELLDGAYRSQLSECADSLTRPVATVEEGTAAAAVTRPEAEPARPAERDAGSSAPHAGGAGSVRAGTRGSAAADVGAASISPSAGAEAADDVDSWEQELQAELARIETAP